MDEHKDKGASLKVAFFSYILITEKLRPPAKKTGYRGIKNRATKIARNEIFIVKKY